MGIRLEIGPQHVGPIPPGRRPDVPVHRAPGAAAATLARLFKEAQTYMGVLILGPMLPGVMSALYPMETHLDGCTHARSVCPPDRCPRRPPSRTQRVPLLCRHLFAGERDLVRITTGLFRSEHIIFGR